MAFESENPGTAVPRHVGIIMDGNGRWAAERGRPRSFGHKAGMEAVRRAVRAAGDLGVSCLTLYAFSSENWSRPEDEIQDLFGLMKFFINRDLAELCANGVRIRILGDRDGVPRDIGQLIETAEAKSRENDRIELNIAFNYGARDEIRRAFRKVLARVASGEIDPDALSEADIGAALDTAGLRTPDPDLVIRTSGEMRLSNFMLWQSAYAELVFLPCMWPDFDRGWFARAIEEYASRSRKYGGIAPARDIAL